MTIKVGIFMINYYEFVKNYLEADSCMENTKYCNLGTTFCVCREEVEGCYWFYETNLFIVEIHDFFIKKELVHSATPNMNQFMSFSSSYIITGNGESFNPYQTLSANSLYIVDIENIHKDYKFLLHNNFPYLSVGISFKKELIEEYLSSLKKEQNISYSDIFTSINPSVVKSFAPLAREILNCKMASPAAELFFEAKAKEWLSLTINAFFNNRNITISKDDDQALMDVAKYLDDHYAIDVAQDTLEKIASMSGTKLKKLFKQKYQVSITEYSQGKRMNIAETLLLNSPLSIKEISESVGYSSHSKFSSYFKKVKGIYPRDVRKLAKKGNCTIECDKCKNNFD